MDPKLTTLMGGSPLGVIFADGRPEEITVRQIPIGDYERGFGLVEDEIALVGFLAGQDKAWAATLTPESYEQILATGREVNARGFFAFTDRQLARLQRTLALMTPEMARLALEAGKSISPTTSPKAVRKLI